MNESVENRDIRPYKQSRTMGISHLIYADDLLAFCKAKESCLLAVGKVLEKFTTNIGLMVSIQKSTIHFSEGTRNKNELLQILNYKEGKFPITYLELAPAPRILIVKDCEPLINSIFYLTVEWKKAIIPGRVQLFH